MANFNLQITTYTPLHIGNGKELCRSFDYQIDTRNGKDVTVRYDTDKILADKYDRKYPGRLPDELIKGSEGNPAYYRYKISGIPRSQGTDSRIKECVKNSYDIPYIPGSSIKGAIRTVYGAKFLSDNRDRYSLSDNIDFWQRDKKKVDDVINSAIFGEKIRNDPFRALFISDALLYGNMRKDDKYDESMIITNVNSYSIRNAKSSVPIELECIRNRMHFFADLKVDDYVIERNNFSDLKRFSESFIENIKSYTNNWLEKLSEWYQKLENNEKIINIIYQLMELNSSQPENSAFLQIGFGTGWDGKTYSDWIQSDDDFFEDVYARYLRRKVSSREPGESFPTSRKAITSGNKSYLPLGWVLLTLEPK